MASNVVEYSTTEIGDDEIRPSWLMSKPKLSTKDITLNIASIDHSTLRKFLQCFPALQTFSYEDGGTSAGPAYFEPPHMMASLEHLKYCLQDLTLLTRNVCGADDYELYPIGNLSRFRKLRRIEMSATMLIGKVREKSESDKYAPSQSLVDTLPVTIRDLVIYYSQPSIMSHIDGLLSSMSRFTSFKSLDLKWETTKYPDKFSPLVPTFHHDFTEAEAMKVVESCKAAGVELVLTAYPPRAKVITWPVDAHGEMGSLEMDGFYGSCEVPYPYTDYEKICELHGCDPATGRQRTLPPSGATIDA